MNENSQSFEWDFFDTIKIMILETFTQTLNLVLTTYNALLMYFRHYLSNIAVTENLEGFNIIQVSHMDRSALWHSTADGRGAEAMHG